MKIVNSRQIMIAFSGILAATLATGCFGGGAGYSGGPYGYNSGYGNSYPSGGYNSGYSYGRSPGNSYNAGYQSGVRADVNRDNSRPVAADRNRVEAPAQAQHSSVDRDKYSRNDVKPEQSSEKN